MGCISSNAKACTADGVVRGCVRRKNAGKRIHVRATGSASFAPGYRNNLRSGERNRNESLYQAMKTFKRGRRRVAVILILLVDAGFAGWGAMAAAFPDFLSGPGGKPILLAGYEGYTGTSWSDIASTSPATADYMELLFRMYGMFNLVFGLITVAIAITAFRRGERWAWWTILAGNTIALISAMTYDRTVRAIGPFELSEYLGLVLIFIALAITWNGGNFPAWPNRQLRTG
jgi:hypothetical protein